MSMHAPASAATTMTHADGPSLLTRHLNEDPGDDMPLVDDVQAPRRAGERFNSNLSAPEKAKKN